ncbi:hypothetical protein N9948_01620 [bacterium]|nr:hypothetical protein [bacterium]
MKVLRLEWTNLSLELLHDQFEKLNINKDNLINIETISEKRYIRALGQKETREKIVVWYWG